MEKCPNCGAQIKIENQKYCEQCGTELIYEVQEEPVKPSQIVSPKPKFGDSKLGLFDINRNYYVIKETAWDMGFGDIKDEKGQLIGRMNRVIFSVRRRVELQELDGTISATIHSKILTARGAQDLKDANGVMIARIKRKIFTFFRQLFYLEDPITKTRWYEAEGDFMGWSFKIYEVGTRKLIAEIEKADRWRDVFLGGIFDFSDTYALKILDNETDRRILLGFCLAIDNVLHDTGGMGPMGPIPFGPRRGRIPGPGPFGNPHRRR